MNIVVINGSPKGKYSITLQTILFLQKKFASDSFQTIDAGQRIKQFEKDFSECKRMIEAADLIIFAYPVYTFIVPSQLHRFIELMKENNVNISGKFATQISTSKHFYDVTAHNFIRDNCGDMKAKYIKGLSADMDDLLEKRGQKDAVAFFEYVKWCVANDLFEEPFVKEYTPHHVIATVPESTPKKAGKVVNIVADIDDSDEKLKAMVERFRAVLPYETKVVNIREFPFMGGCISCFNCAASGKCIYKDGFDTFLRENIQTGDAIVIAFSIKDHSMGSRFKTYDDRQFCNGHRTVTMGMPFAYLVSGDLSEEENLRMIIEGRAEVGGNFLAGVATDEKNTDEEIDAMAKKLSFAMENAYVQPSNFLGVGGSKIFRDLIWLMQGMMKADHKFFKAHGQYDFPQKKRGRMLAMYLVGGLISNPKIKAKMGNKMNEGMLAPYKKILEE